MELSEIIERLNKAPSKPLYIQLSELEKRLNEARRNLRQSLYLGFFSLGVFAATLIWAIIDAIKHHQ